MLQELLLASIYSRRGASPPTSKQANKQAERKLCDGHAEQMVAIRIRKFTETQKIRTHL
jgi:hypothetical protein